MVTKEKTVGSKALALCCGSFALGGAGGFAFAAWLGLGADYLAGYALGFSAGVQVSFGEVFWNVLRWPLFVWVLGFTALGLWMTPMMFALRGFFLCFGVACLSGCAHGGLLLAFALFGLDALVMLPVFFFLGVRSWTQAAGQRGRLWTRPGEMPPAFWLKSALALLCVLCCSGVEYWLLPTLLKTMAPLLGAG